MPNLAELIILFCLISHRPLILRTSVLASEVSKPFPRSTPRTQPSSISVTHRTPDAIFCCHQENAREKLFELTGELDMTTPCIWLQYTTTINQICFNIYDSAMVIIYIEISRRLGVANDCKDELILGLQRMCVNDNVAEASDSQHSEANSKVVSIPNKVANGDNTLGHLDGTPDVVFCCLDESPETRLRQFRQFSDEHSCYMMEFTTTQRQLCVSIFDGSLLERYRELNNLIGASQYCDNPLITGLQNMCLHMGASDEGSVRKKTYDTSPETQTSNEVRNAAVTPTVISISSDFVPRREEVSDDNINEPLSEGESDGETEPSNIGDVEGIGSDETSTGESEAGDANGEGESEMAPDGESESQLDVESEGESEALGKRDGVFQVASAAAAAEHEGNSREITYAEPGGISEGEGESESEPIAELSEEQTRIIIALLGVTMAAILVLNTTILATILKFKELQTQHNMFIVSLASADICVGVFVIPGLMSGYFDESYMSTAVCRLCHYAAYTSTAASMFTVSAIASDRFRSVVFPLKPKLGFTGVALAIIAIWILAGVYGVRVPPVFSLHIEEFLDDGVLSRVMTCNVERENIVLNRILFTMDFFIVFAIPCLCMVFCYVGISYTVSKKTIETNNEKVRLRQTRKIIRILIILTTSFFILHLPLHIFRLYLFWVNTYFPNAQDILSYLELLSFANSLLNPLFYGLYNGDLRKGCIKLYGLEGVFNKDCFCRRLFFRNNVESVLITVTAAQ